MPSTEAGHHANMFYVDQDGNPHLNGASFYIDESGTIFAAAEIGFLDGVTAGTAAASKAVVLDASKGIATITTATITTLTSTTVNATNVDAGASGTAGSVDVFPSTAAKGKIAITAADSAGDTTTTIVNASQAGARTYTIPDAGASASFVMTAGTQTISGALTCSGGLTVSTAGLTITDVNVVLSATTGTKIGTATTQKLGFFNATPVVQPSAYTQTYATADKTHANLTLATLTDSSGGTAADTIAAITGGGANCENATKNAIATFAREQARTVADLTDLKQLVNSLIDDLQTLGLIG